MDPQLHWKTKASTKGIEQADKALELQYHFLFQETNLHLCEASSWWIVSKKMKIFESQPITNHSPRASKTPRLNRKQLHVDVYLREFHTQLIETAALGVEDVDVVAWRLNPPVAGQSVLILWLTGSQLKSSHVLREVLKSAKTYFFLQTERRKHQKAPFGS